MNEWVPVKDRLPKDYSRVLITINGLKGLRVRSATYYENGVFNSDNGETWKVGEEGLLAWMSLPKPYESKGNLE